MAVQRTSQAEEQCQCDPSWEAVERVRLCAVSTTPYAAGPLPVQMPVQCSDNRTSPLAPPTRPSSAARRQRIDELSTHSNVKPIARSRRRRLAFPTPALPSFGYLFRVGLAYRPSQLGCADAATIHTGQRARHRQTGGHPGARAGHRRSQSRAGLRADRHQHRHRDVARQRDRPQRSDGQPLSPGAALRRGRAGPRPRQPQRDVRQRRAHPRGDRADRRARAPGRQRAAAPRRGPGRARARAAGARRSGPGRGEPGHAGHRARRRAPGQLQRLGAGAGRDRHRQGADRARDPRVGLARVAGPSSSSTPARWRRR